MLFVIIDTNVMIDICIPNCLMLTVDFFILTLIIIFIYLYNSINQQYMTPVNHQLYNVSIIIHNTSIRIHTYVYRSLINRY